MTIKMRKVGAGLIGLLTTLAVVGGSAPSAMADETNPTGPPPKVELVLDVSGSMKANDAGGMTRMDAAKKAFNEVVDSVPEPADFGVRVLGATYPGNDKAKGCVDTQQLAPVGRPNKVVIKNEIAKLAPTGWTPIALSLREAAKDLGTGAGSRRIVLITDGEETCAPPDPCDVARELAASGLNLIVDTLGLVPDENTRRQLSCIAEATGGTYTSVLNADELSQKVQQIVKRAVREADETPAAVKGSPNGCQDAPLLAPGVYSDREEFGQHLWYKVPLKPNQELRATATVGSDRKVARDYDVTVTAFSEDGRELVGNAGAGNGRTDVQSAGLRYPYKTDSDHAKTRTICLVVTNAFAAQPNVATKPGLPLELTVDLVKATDSKAANVHGLGRGWVFLGVLAGFGLIAGLLAGWLRRAFKALGKAMS
ncbi:VWA domain-containing protein [Embleya scabrispora]|uniref:VWA domain-containing protein n=1 Tax=Embleya scabrispora TaxID=159449 RepID=UPI00036EC2CA